MSKQKTILIVLISVLMAGNIYSGVSYFFAQRNLQATELRLKTQQNNERVIDFAKLFIEKVLKAQSEVSFEDRLKLETAVRNLKDTEILDQWEKFIGSKTEKEAQDAVKDLLALLINKIPY